MKLVGKVPVTVGQTVSGSGSRMTDGGQKHVQTSVAGIFSGWDHVLHGPTSVWDFPAAAPNDYRQAVLRGTAVGGLGRLAWIMDSL